MRRIVLLRAARRDLDDIWSYIAERDVDAADRLIDRLKRATLLLAERPYAGMDAAILRPGLRKWTVGAYVVFYLIGAGRIEIVRIVHSARDHRRLGMT